jgi:hypothetical protein
MDMRANSTFASALAATFGLVLTLVGVLSAQGTTVDPKAVPVIDGGAGPCSADLTVTDSSSAPVYAATISVHIAYGFMGARRLDLEVGTNVDGKARFTGLPSRTKRGLTFHAAQGDRDGTAFDDPATTCKAQLTIVLEKKSR